MSTTANCDTPASTPPASNPPRILPAGAAVNAHTALPTERGCHANAESSSHAFWTVLTVLLLEASTIAAVWLNAA